MYTDVLRTVNRFQRMSWMTRLPPCQLATRLSQTPWTWLGKSITRRRFAAIAAVLGTLVFQNPNAGFLLDEQLNETLDQGDYCFFALLVGRMDIFTCG
jgi:hypothetical protein